MNLKKEHKTDQSDRIDFGRVAAFGMGGLIPVALFNIAGQLMGLLGNISMGLSAFWLGVILIIPRLWDAFSDPMMGHISDNAQTRWGRRRPFILIGAIAVAVTFVAMWWGPQKSSTADLNGSVWFISWPCCFCFIRPAPSLRSRMVR